MLLWLVTGYGQPVSTLPMTTAPSPKNKLRRVNEDIKLVEGLNISKNINIKPTNNYYRCTLTHVTVPGTC